MSEIDRFVKQHIPHGTNNDIAPRDKPYVTRYTSPGIVTGYPERIKLIYEKHPTNKGEYLQVGTREHDQHPFMNLNYGDLFTLWDGVNPEEAAVHRFGAYYPNGSHYGMEVNTYRNKNKERSVIQTESANIKHFRMFYPTYHSKHREHLLQWRSRLNKAKETQKRTFSNSG